MNRKLLIGDDFMKVIAGCVVEKDIIHICYSEAHTYFSKDTEKNVTSILFY